ncbi:uroporphyrinogen decarboxylase (uro-d) [Lucifera butyrica]|uniref:Uroporphyrinogen decarboxylase (Uro-d) n=1 Tax=Lucifera butyrica TaxID=1351585 RepID=A0A498R6B4_9FIRM|nr:uroporphyrinogen decarboxylase family protein [Lucifera butyrica]VBB05763.1 uroporphyrinogen decarboxylase (uro-d) [Lucifera butyrica]
MNCREREKATLSFSDDLDRGAVEEIFYPWEKTVKKWENEGLSTRFSEKVMFPTIPTDNLYFPRDREIEPEERYLNCLSTEEVFIYEQNLGFDPLKRVAFRVPFLCFDEKLIEETSEYKIKLDRDGWKRKYYKTRDLIQELRPVVSNEEDWQQLKDRVQKALDEYCTDENIQKIYGCYKEGHDKGDFAIRFRASGFFWTPRTLLGIEPHLMAFYDYPEMLHDINEFVLKVYMEKLDKILDIISPNVVFFEEDLSGSSGPMLSPALFDEFVGAYYKRLIPFLKKKGVANVFVDTDGEFNVLIPNFVEAGIDGFLPMDVQGGMDIVAVREKYSTLKFIGGYNKLEIARGKDAINKEFERIMPVIKQGGYLPCNDHQVPPDAPLENYKYYIKRLREVMQQARGY